MLKTKLNILVVFNSLLGVIGGVSRHIVEVVNYWIASHKVDYLISESGYRVAEEHIQRNPSPNKNVIVYSTPFDDARKLFLAYISRTIKSILLAVRKLKGKYDIVIAPNYLPQNMIPAMFLKRDAKLVVYFHTIQPSLRKEYLEKMNLLRRAISIMNWNLCVFLAKAFDLIFVVNEATRDYFIETGFAPEKVVVVNNGIPYKEIASIDIERKEYEGVFLGRLVQRKGIYDLMKIWKVVIKKHPSAKLCIIGGGSEKRKLETKIEEERLKENVILTGVVSDEEKYKLMKKSKVFISPSYYEAKPIVILEAFACELPIVAYDLPVYKEVFNGYVFTVEIGNCEEMAKKIIDTLESPEAYGKIIKEAKNFVSKYDWEEIANYQLSCIKRL